MVWFRREEPFGDVDLLNHDEMERKDLMTGKRKGPHDNLEKVVDDSGSSHEGGMAAAKVEQGRGSSSFWQRDTHRK